MSEKKKGKNNKITNREEARAARKARMKKEPVLVTVYFLLRLIVIAVLVLQFFNGNYYNVFLCILTLILLMGPSIIEHRFKIDIPDGIPRFIL